MTISLEQHLTALIQQAIAAQWPQLNDFPVVLKRAPTEEDDWTCHAAFRLAAILKMSPIVIAETLLSAITWPESIAHCTVAPPAFLNIRLTADARWSIIHKITENPDQFGHQTAKEARILLEFVSANPTGPLHVGHARQAAIGDTLARIFTAQGWSVTREFYYNDQGNQIHQLTESVRARIHGIEPGNPDFPTEGYRGAYIGDIAQAFMAQEIIQLPTEHVSIRASGDVTQYDDVRRFAVAYLRQEQDEDIRAFGVQFDHYFLESSLYTNGAITDVINTWTQHGFTYTKDHAQFLKTTTFGDDKDRVFQKSSGDYTYFTPDVAYHLNKFSRGFTRVVNIQGSDHQGTVARVRAGLQALQCGIPTAFPEYLLHSMVKIVRAGQELKVSKRAGTYVTLRDLIALAGLDATRFFLIWRKMDAPFVFDIDLATQRTEDNPVYYIQYAHARICSVLAQRQTAETQEILIDPTFINKPIVIQLLKKLADFPDILYTITQELTVHLLPHYLLSLAGQLHHFYNAERILTGQAQEEAIRLQLIRAIGAVLKQGLHLMGVSAPDKM